VREAADRVGLVGWSSVACLVIEPRSGRACAAAGGFTSIETFSRDLDVPYCYVTF
jgi:hypothetical protein